MPALTRRHRRRYNIRGTSCCLCLPPASMLRPSLPSDSWASDTVSRRCAPTELADASRIRSGSSTTAGLTTLTPLSSQTTLPNSTAATGLSDNHRHRDLIYVSLQPDSQSFNAGFRTVLFNAQSVGSSEKRAEISTFVSDNGIDLLFITETWLNPRGDEANIADLAPSGYSARSFPRRSRGGGLAVIFRDTLATNLRLKLSLTSTTHHSNSFRCLSPFKLVLCTLCACTAHHRVARTS